MDLAGLNRINMSGISPLGSRVAKGECIEIVLEKYESMNF